MTLNFTEATAYRKLWMPQLFQEFLFKAAIIKPLVDYRTDNVKYIENPYGSAGTVTQNSSIVGTYSVGTYTVTADTLTVTEEFVYSEHVYSFEKIASVADVKGARMKDAMGQTAYAVDKYALNELCDKGTGVYSTPTGGFSQANALTIAANLASKLVGFAASYASKYIVIEPSDVPGVLLAMFGSGFATADRALNNGFLNHWADFDWYVCGASTFVTATLGTTNYTNSGHRVAGVKGLATLLMPAGEMIWMEKEVTGKTGAELALATYAGLKVWAQKASLTIDITLV